MTRDRDSDPLAATAAAPLAEGSESPRAAASSAETLVPQVTNEDVAVPPVRPSRPRASTPLADTLVAAGEGSSPATGNADTAVDAPRERKSFDLGGQVKIGRFVLLEKLGEGGMGLVLAAFDPHLDRRVAIKMLHDNISETHGSRLEREAKAMAQLNHPNVLTVHETGMYGERLYIAMELVDGTTMREWLRAKPRTHDEVLDVMTQAGRGLAAAHAGGLVHRDFKPDNVLVGKDGRVRVSDFGLVSSSGELTTVDGKSPAVTSPSALTQTGAVMGTPLYMAPEQHRGKVADAKADQFSFCVSLWQALCDQMPYGADTYEDLVENVSTGRLLPIPRGARVPAKIRAILQRGLASDAAERFPSMQALLMALERARRPLRWPLYAGGAALVAGGAVALSLAMTTRGDPCEGSGARFAKIWDRGRVTPLAATFQVALGSDVWTRIKRGVDGWTEAWAVHHREVCRATHVRGEQSPELLDLRMRCLDGKLAELDALLARLGDTTTESLFKALDASANLPNLSDCDDAARLRATIPLPTDPKARAQIRELEQAFTEAASYDKLGKFGRARELVEPLVGQASVVGYAPLEAKLVLLRAGLEYRSGDLAAAAVTYREAAETAARARDDERLAQSWIDLMNVLAAAGKHADALALEPIARTSTERVSDQPRLGARFANTLAGIYLAQGKYPDAKREYEKALELVKRDGPDSDLLGPALTNLGMVLWYVGDRDGAKQNLEAARARFVTKLGPRHPSLGYIHRNLGDLAAGQGDTDGALAQYEQARQVFEDAHGPDHIDVAIALEPLAYAYALKGEIGKAREAGERALAIREKKFGNDHLSIATTLDSLADAEIADGKPEALVRAVGYLERALAIKEATTGKEHPKLPDTIDRLGQASIKQGKLDAAIAHYEHSLAIRIKAQGPRHNDTAYGHLRVGETHLAARHFGPAADAYHHAEKIFETNDPKDADIARARFGRARALYASGKRAEAVALAKSARALLDGNDAAAQMATAIDAWLEKP